MENIEQKSDNKKTLKDNPEYFGAYLNMARHNVFNINNHLAKKFSIAELDEEGKLPNSFLTDKNNKKFKANQNHIFSILKRFMPIVKVFDHETLPKSEREQIKDLVGKDIAKLADTLGIVFNAINAFRNDYTHYYSISKGNKRKIEIEDGLIAFLNTNYKRAIEYTKARFTTVYNDADFDLASKAILVNADNTITQDGLVFLISMFLDRENSFQFVNRITGLKGTQYKSFTAKREVLSAFCIKLPEEKFVSENYIQAFSLELINELNKCPKALYNVIDEEEKKKFQPILGADEIDNIIDNSVPDTIDDYENYIESITKRVRSKNRFSYFALKFLDDKKIFKNLRFQIDLGKLVIAEYTKPLDGIEHERRVIENAKAFGRLQDLRNNEENILRKIDKNTTAYFEQYAPHYNFDNNKIGISIFKDGNERKESFATYIFNEKSTNTVKAHLKQPEVTAFLSTHELPKIILLEYLQTGTAEQLINDFITINNPKLFNLKFIESVKIELNDLDEFLKRSQGRKNIHAYYLKDNRGNETKDTQKIDDLKDRKSRLNAILLEHSLNDKQIPTRILDYWLYIVDVQEKNAVSDRIKQMKRDCIDRLKDIKKGKAPRIGEMATFLAKDIVDMLIDEAKKKKITSFYYDKMQQSLALYADNDMKDILDNIINDLGLNEKGGHPFLKEINFRDLKYTQEIYKKYLEEKGQKMVSEYNHKKMRSETFDKSWLETTFYKKEFSEKINKNLTVVKIPEDKSKIPFSILQFEKAKTSFEDWFNNITKGKKVNDRKKPIDLPTDLFDASLVKLLQDKLKSENIGFDVKANYNELFKIWWEKYRKDDTQIFYKAKRCYAFEEEKLIFEMNTKNKFQEYCTDDFVTKVHKIRQDKRNNEKQTNSRLPDIDKKQVAKSIANRIGSTEKEIRILQEEDRLMLLMFEQLIGAEPSLKLKEIDKLLNETIEIKEKITGKLSFNEQGENIQDNNTKLEITRFLTENRKRKEYSVLKKYINDRRLFELFEYFEPDTIALDKLKIEIDSYNKAKETVFDLIFKLEKAIVEHDKEGVLEKAEKETDHIQHKPYLEWLKAKKIITDEDFRFLNMIRKTFSHNQYAQKTTMELFVKNWNENKFALQMLETYKLKMENIIINIKKTAL